MITIAHTADWQIGKPFGSFPPETANVLMDARLEIIDRVAEAARGAGARDVLVAGDVFDAADVAGRWFRQPIDKLARHDDLTWHLLPGNHDPARPGSVWERLQRAGPPSNVRSHLTPEPTSIGQDAWLLPSPVAVAGRADDPTSWMNSAVTPAGAIRVGLAHGSVVDFGGEDDGIVSPTRAHEARLDYLALGDWHGTVEVGPRTWYSGTPEPDRFLENDPGNILIVRLGGSGAQPSVERIRTGRFIWVRRQATLETLDDLRRLETEILDLVSEPDRLLLRLGIDGQLPLDDVAQLEAWEASFAARLRLLEMNSTNLRIAAGGLDVARFDAGTQLHAAATWLKNIIEGPDQAERVLAEAALVRLFALASFDDRATP